MIGFEQLAARYFPQIEPINAWIKLAEYWTQKSDVILSYDEAHELLYSYLLFSLTDTGFTLVIEEEANFLALRTQFSHIDGFAFLSIQDSQESQRKAISDIENNTVKVLVVSIERFFQKGNKFLEYLKSYQVQQIAIHSAHKLSLWGTFDEIFAPLTQLKTFLKHVPVIAVSPLFSHALQKDVKSILHLHEPTLLLLNNLPDAYTYFIYIVEPHSDIQAIIQNIAQQHSSEQGAFISKTTQNYLLPNNISTTLSMQEAKFAIFMELPHYLEDIYTFQQKYNIPTLYFVYDENEVKRKKIELKNNFKQKLHQDIAIKRFEEVIQWATANVCKKQILQKHWQMPINELCGRCNVCLAEKNISVHKPEYAHDIKKLKDILIAKRLSIAKASNILVPQVFSDITIDEIAIYLPQNKQDLVWIAGLGIKKVELYGDMILDIVLDFCASNEVSSNMDYLRTIRKKMKFSKNSGIVVSVVKKAKINAAIHEVGHWNSQLICDFLNNEEITLAEIENIIATIEYSF